MKTRIWLTVLVAVVASGLVWAFSPWLSGHTEPWDAESYYYLVALFATGLISGLLVPRPLWAHYLGALIGQLSYQALFIGTGPLFALGGVFLLGYSLVFVVAAGLAAQFRRRL
jgi:hypothetical protein